MIATDKTTILEIKAIIALHSDFKFDKVSPAIKATGHLTKRMLHVQPLPCKTILDTTQATISWKTRDQNDVRRYPHTQRLIENVRGSRRCALRTFQNSSTASSLYITLLKHMKMFYIILEITFSSFN